jgi:hypothetical protein
MEIQNRLRIFFERLRAAPPARTAYDALALICRLIEEVEDEFCSVPRVDPPPRTPTGRMYSPQADSITFGEGGVMLVKTLGHLIRCHPEGSIVIENTRTNRVELRKSGAEH